MKAFLLAAGRGTRLRPLTDHVPKCLVPIEGKALLGIWFDMLVEHGVTEVLVNTHYLPAKVEDFAKAGTPAGLKVELVNEPELLGSSGTVLARRDFVKGEKEFFVLYADNLTDIDLTDFLRFHRSRKTPFSMALFRTESPRECGIATLDPDQRVVAFEEKPRDPPSNLANAGLYVVTPEVLDMIPGKKPSDFGFDVLPQLIGRMYGYPIPGFFCDLGTPERLNWAREHWPKRTSNMNTEFKQRKGA